MAVLGLRQTADYWETLHAANDELQELIEAVVVPETWFFRDPDAFTALARLISEEWLPYPRAEALRLLSVPCCSGEEPYSMVMALLDAGVRQRKAQCRCGRYQCARTHSGSAWNIWIQFISGRHAGVPESLF